MQSTSDKVAKTAKNKKKRQPAPKKHAFLRRFVILMAKLFIVIIAYLAIYAIYLDAKIRERIEGDVWELPAAVYGRMINLEPGMEYSQHEMIALLVGSQYQQVDRLTKAGDFVVKNNTIELLRRPFDFPDGAENEIHARLIFDNNELTRIQNVTSGRDFGFFRLDPKLITMLRSATGEQRLFMPRSTFPNELIQALLVTEDRDFYHHGGVSIKAILRAIIADLHAGRMVQGGSTLTQQLMKNLFLTNDRSLTRKLKEVMMAIIFDARYSKDRILELYMNEVYLGQSGKGGRGGEQIRGFPLASLYYFGRPVSELTIDQQAMLVAMAKGAGLYNPWRNPERLLERRNLVLQLLCENQFIDQIEYQSLITRPLGVQSEGAVIAPQPAFIDLVLQELNKKLDGRLARLSGMKIFTTLDPVSQSAAEKAVEEGIPVLRKTYKLDDLETALVIVDRLSGEVRAMVGGVQTRYSGFNRALQARRPIGSLAKPPIYLAALNLPDRYQLNSWLTDQPISVPIAGNKIWEPKNYDRKYRNHVMLINALSQSLNLPTVHLGLDIGLDKVAEMMIQLGAPKEDIQQVPAMLLGSTSMTPFELAQIYQTIGSGGHRAPISSIRSIIAQDGSVHYQSYPYSQLVVPPQPVYLTLYAMQQAARSGTGRALASEFGQYNFAIKTGTTNDLRDSWFTGIDGKEVVVVWVGRDNNAQTNLTGSNGALTLFRRYMQNQTPLKLTLQRPEDIAIISLDDKGYLTCEARAQKLPIWTNNEQASCAESQQQERQQMEDTAVTPPEKREEKVDWFTELFR